MFNRDDLKQILANWHFPFANLILFSFSSFEFARPQHDIFMSFAVLLTRFGLP